MILRFLFIFFMLFTSSAWGAVPKLFFSDLIDGPIDGWEESATKGAAITIFGQDFGSAVHTSYITCAGQTIYADEAGVAEWAATTNPTTARGMQRITFYLNSSMDLGAATISVTTADGTSQTIPFYTRSTGNIYFVSTAGNDTNSGLSVANAWRNPSKARAALQTGDIAYFKSGIYNTVDNWEAIVDFWATNHGNGAANNGIALASYPGESAQFGDSSTTYTIRHHGSTPDVLSYWTFSKLTLRANYNVTNWGLGDPGSDDHNRFIGNDASTTADGKTVLAFDGHTGGQTYLYLYGNYICDAGVDTRGDMATTKGYSIYMSGYGSHDYVYIGWNELAYNTMGRGIQIYGHTVADTIDHLYIHDNYIHHNAYTGCVLGGGDGAGGSYEYNWVHNLYFYNNILSGNGTDTTVAWADIQVGGVGWGVLGGNYYIYNNTFYNAPGGAIDFDGKPDSVTLKNNIFFYSASFGSVDDIDNDTHPTGSNNIWAGGATDTPAWDTDPITTDPLFVLDGSDFRLTSLSDAIEAGADLSATLATDYDGLDRPQSTSFDIGAFEYLAGETDTVDPTVVISTMAQTVQCDSIVITWEDGDNIAVTGRKWRIGSAPDATHGTAATSPATVTGMAIGVNTIYIGAGDAAGNWGSDSVAITYTGICQPEVSVGRYGATGAHGVYSSTGAIIQ